MVVNRSSRNAYGVCASNIRPFVRSNKGALLANANGGPASCGPFLLSSLLAVARWRQGYAGPHSALATAPSTVRVHGGFRRTRATAGTARTQPAVSVVLSVLAATTSPTLHWNAIARGTRRATLRSSWTPILCAHAFVQILSRPRRALHHRLFHWHQCWCRHRCRCSSLYARRLRVKAITGT